MIGTFFQWSGLSTVGPFRSAGLEASDPWHCHVRLAACAPYLSWQGSGHHCLLGLSPSSLAPAGDAGSLAVSQREAASWLT